MALNFNVDPYFDDFDPTKNFHRILFKPGFAVQARELTQAQTILQNQISNFADHIFTQNSPVSGGKVTTNLNNYYLKLNLTTPIGEEVVAENFLNKDIQDSTGTIRAKVIATTEASQADSPTLYVSYYSGVQFSNGEQIFCTDGSNFTATTIDSNSTGKTSTASISQGIFYIVNGYNLSSTPNPDGTFTKYSIGHFVQVSPQTIVLDKYSNTPSYRVGLSITESIVDYINDPSLLDPAVGASNYQAPGADRFKISLDLTSLPLTLGNDDQFIELVRISNGTVIKQVDGSVYSVIDDYFAKRDYESNGDYIVNDFKLTPSSNTVNSAQYDLKIGKGLAYVHGYRIENQSDVVLGGISRARTTETINNNAVYIDYGSYLTVTSANGIFDVTTMPVIDLHCTPNSDIVTTNTATYSSTLVGSARIRNIQYSSSGANANTPSYVYKAYISDINTTTLNGAASSGTPTTITFSGTGAGGKFSTAANAYFGTTIALTGGTSVGDIRRIVSYNGATRTATVDAPFTVTPDNTTNFSLKFSTSIVDSIIARNSGNVIIATADIANAGKISGVASGDTILENPTAPEMLFLVGYPYVANIANSDYVSTKVFRAKTFTASGGNFVLTITIPSGTPLTFLGTGTLSADVIKQNFTVINKTTGKILDFCSAGQTVALSSDRKTVTFTTNSYGGVIVDVIAAVNVANADNVTNVLKTKNLVTGNTTVASIAGPDGIINNTFIDLTKGQVYIRNSDIGAITSLYVSDVKKIRKIIDTKEPGTAATDAMLTNSAFDITRLFQLDNGQRDNYYDHAALNLVAGANKPAGNILVVFDYYSHTGGDGYFDVNSYLAPISTSPERYEEIATYLSTNGTTYQLSDSLDFRPVRKNAQAAFIFNYTGNPAVDDSGILIPQNLSEYVSDYDYYLGRKDKLVLTKDRSFVMIPGTPSVNPVFPKEPDGSLVLANLTYDPYTAYVPGEVPNGGQPDLSIEKIVHKNWIKRDITDLQTRVNDLEYYTSLSLLETNAQSLQVPDVNGLNRFKNGILVDDFSSFSTADTANKDFGTKINTTKKRLSPISTIDNYQLQNPIVLNSLGTLKTFNNLAVSSINGTGTNIFTLPYTSANVVTQSLASSVVSLNPFNVVEYEGVATITPPMDNWVDNSQAPDLLIVNPGTQIYQQTNGVNVTNAGDWTTIPGTSYSTTSTTTATTGRATVTTTTTQAYSDQIRNITTAGSYAQVSSTTGFNNGYLTNVSILPYIRPQQLIFKAEGLLVNSPVSTFFDGVNVDNYITSPNTIELTSVSGTFSENDIVGFYYSNRFNPIGRVVSIYKYPTSTNIRLYIANLLGAPSYSPTNVVQNAFFNSSGAYTSTSASGTINTSAATARLSTSGVLSGVGGSYNNTITSGLQLYKVQNSTGWGTFLNQYGVWGDLRASASYSATFAVDPEVAGTYKIQVSSSGAYTLTANGSTVASGSANPTSVNQVNYTLSPAQLGVLTLAWSVTGSPGPSGIGVVVKDPSDQIVFASTAPTNLAYDSVAQQVVMPEGGAWFTGVTKVKLDGNAANVANYYVGTKISVTSTYVYAYTTQTATYVPPPTPRRAGGGGCFIEDTLVLLENGETKKISEVQIGEKVYNWNKTKINTVTFVEKTLDDKFEAIYSVKKKEKPFATINHPLYIDGELSSPISEKVYEMYPWLGKAKQIEAGKTIPAQGKLVYNLWVDGDGTYQVNGYGTTSIIGEGGVLRKVTEREMITSERASELLFKFTDEGKNLAYGAYLLNNYFGKLDIGLINSILVRAFKNDENKFTQKSVMLLFKIFGKLACIVNGK